MAAVVSVPLVAAVELFAGSREVVAGRELRQGSSTPSATQATIAGFAAGEVGGYAVLALRGLLEVVNGGQPEPFLLR